MCAGRARSVIRSLPRAGSVGLLLLQCLNQAAKLRLVRTQRRKCPGIQKRGCNVALVARYGHQRAKHLCFRRMLLIRALKHGHGALMVARRIHRDGVDVCVADVLRRQFHGFAQQDQRLGVFTLADQQQA